MGRPLFAKSFAIAGLVTAGAALLFSMLVLDTEPWFGVATSIVWMTLNFPGQVVSMIVSGDIHHTTGAGFYLGAAVQWFLIGYFAVRAIRHRFHPAPDSTRSGPGGNTPEKLP